MADSYDEGFEDGREAGWPGLGYVFTSSIVAGVGFTIGVALASLVGTLIALLGLEAVGASIATWLAN